MLPRQDEGKGVPGERIAQGIEEVIVTSQKRAASAQKTAISLSVWRGKELQTLGITNIQALTSVAPDVNILQNEGNAVITIRGISSHDVSEIGDPAVAIATDGVYTNRGFSFNSSFYDLDRIEIERGPQGTLAGRSAVGGAINLVTAKPTNRKEANAKVEFGNYGAVNSWAMVNIPFSDKVQLRAAFSSSYNEGYRDLGTSGYGDGANNVSGRLTLGLHPFKGFQGTITYQGTRMGGAGPVVYNSPYQFDASGNLITSIQPLPSGSLRHLDVPTRPALSSLDHALRWNFEYTLPYITLTYLGGYSTTNYSETNDSSSNVSYSRLIETWNANARPKTQNQEFRISSDQSYRFFWTTGVYYFKENDSLYSYDNIPVDGVWAKPLIFDYQTIARSLAWYAHGTYRILPTLRITGGVRYTWDEKTRSGSILFPEDSSKLPYNYIVSQNYGHGSWTKVTWHAGIEYDITSRNMAYFKVDTGYKPGGFTDLNAYNPETVRAYEVGFKNRFLNNHLQFNVSGFWENYTGQQVSQIVSNYSGGGAIINNAGSSRIYGVDPSLLLRWPEIGEFNLDFQWLHARFRDFAVAVTKPMADGSSLTVMQQFAGNQLPQAPNYSVGAGFSRYWRVPSGRILTQIKTRFQSGTYLYFTNEKDSRQKAYTNTTALAEYFPNMGHWHAQIFVRNLENSRILTYAAENGYANAYAYSFAAPRTFGGAISVEY
uniref:TonB-dependent receptor n=1 Tax=Gluconobacter thailandicus TaxID=257438 RepID=UPI002F90F8AC